MTNDRCRVGGAGRGLAVAASMLALVACGSSPLPVASEVTEPDPDSATALESTVPVTDPTATGATLADAAPAGSGPEVVTGDEWRDVTANLAGLESECGNVSFVSAHPATDQVMVGIARQGLWQLTPRADRWDRLGIAAESDAIRNRTAWIAYDPEQPDRFWESGSYDIGAFRTDDGGSTFTQLGDAEHFDGIGVDLADPERRTLLAGRHEQTELYRSDDGGTTWTMVHGYPLDAGFPSSPVVIDADTFLVGTQGAEESGVYRSDDGGERWTLVRSGNYPYPPVVDGESFFWLSDSSIMVSGDGGATFSLTGQAPRGRSASLAMAAGEVLVALGQQKLVVSYDRGRAWEEVGPPLPFEPVGLAYSSGRNEVYVWRFTCDKSTRGENSVSTESIQAIELVVDRS